MPGHKFRGRLLKQFICNLVKILKDKLKFFQNEFKICAYCCKCLAYRIYYSKKFKDGKEMPNQFKDHTMNTNKKFIQTK